MDQRENPFIPNLLKEIGFRVEKRLLEEGDYILSPECAVERKEAHDFMVSLFNGRLFDQANRLSTAFRIPILILEGDIHTVLQQLTNPRIIWGALCTLTLQYGFNLFFTQGSKETVDLLYILSKQQDYIKSSGPFIAKKFKKDNSVKTQIQILSSLPGIGPKLAVRLLEKFGNIRKIFLASIAELALTDGVGRMKARKIDEILNLIYSTSERPLQQSRLTE